MSESEASAQASVRPVLEDFATELLEAYRTGAPVEPLRQRLPDATLDDAYIVQALQLEHFQRQGRTLAGRKVGLTSLAMQKQLGVDSPDFGFFFTDMVHGDQAEISVASFISPKVEPEFGFVLREDLSGPGVTRDQAAAAIGEIYPAIEIIDSRIRDWDIRLVDTVADNASCGAIAVADTPLPLEVADLATVECVLRIDGEEVGRGAGTAVMGDPVAPLAWLANVLGRQGVPLLKGQLVLPGSFTAAAPVLPGSAVVADFAELGSLSISFV